MSGLSSDELAEDYKSSLEDLSFNSRYEISNLTVIARENIHAAQAIARTLEQHIHNTAPTRKLPALYLLDSIAKNVGTPYTLFFQRNLYQTFMDAYLVVEPPIRRKLEEMLQTWKQPVPGSTSSQPVFASEITRKIDNALIKARTAALQHQQKQMRQNQALGLDRAMGRTPPPPHFRNTPPPPMANGSAPYTNGHGYDHGRSASGSPNGNTPIQNASAAVGLQQLSLQGPPPSSGGSVDTLQSDIFRLIDSCQTAVAREPLNQELQKRLQALVDLRKILQTQQLPEAQLVLVRDQVRALANPTPPPAAAAPPPPTPQMHLPLSTQDLASLLATATHNMPMSFPAVSQPPPIALPASLPQVPIIPPPPPPPMAGFGTNGGMDPASLFASLQKAGLLPNFPGGLPPPPPPPLPSTGALPFPLPLPGNLPRNIMTPPIHHATTVGTNPGNKWDWRTIDVEMKSMSLKIPRPHLIPRLNETLPNKCSSCARRFEDSEKGRKEKRAHLDWHFRVHQRMAESVKRGQNRSWYVGEEEWIKSHDDAEDIMTLETETTAIENATATAESRSEEVRKQYVVVPDASETHRVCPICQEELKYVWHDETDEFVWMDAKQMGGRIYHASCHAEASKDRANGALAGGSRGGTPDSAAGMKRKAEDDEMDRKVKIKSEPTT
ncbi:hypothetical protein K440DRAFT_633181 [Wilcoxina mikolae CBS 423.85]|nr:hypothetical protein K440DRAFT_633181 [Wilcoxina mikolae CBS 423.85]